MKTILCYGDSNTWGFEPGTRARYPRTIRWTGQLQGLLGSGYAVVEEGLNGRTTVWPDPIEGFKSGKEYLIPCLQTHAPIDHVLLLLGSNDLKHRFSLTPTDIARGAATLVGMIQQSTSGINGKAPSVTLMAPPPLAKLTLLKEVFQGGVEKSHQLAARYQAQAQDLGCAFFDVGGVVQSSEIDGIHWEPEQHGLLAKALAAHVSEIL